MMYYEQVSVEIQLLNFKLLKVFQIITPKNWLSFSGELYLFSQIDLLSQHQIGFHIDHHFKGKFSISVMV